MTPQIEINGCSETVLAPINAVVKNDKVILDTEDDSELAEVLRNLRARAIPCDGLHAKKVHFKADDLDTTTINEVVLEPGETVEYAEMDVFVNG